LDIDFLCDEKWSEIVISRDIFSTTMHHLACLRRAMRGTWLQKMNTAVPQS
jgi:hypothetical protein